MNDTVIIVENLWKRYGLPLPGFIRKGQRWCRQLLSSDKRRSAAGPKLLSDGSFALEDVSFEVKRGETLGIIGRNGAGKSSLLKILAGVTPPTSGHVEVRGRVFPMIELNAGIHPELTGRENVRLLGAIMGLSRREIETKMVEIEEFCELDEWFYRPVRMYSSGMLARLGFSIAMNIDANILLIDEVLAVGDLAFQRKCFDRIEGLREKNITTLFVSHSVRQIERICDRVVMLEQGLIVADGNQKEVKQLYDEKISDHNLSLVKQKRFKGSAESWVGTGEIIVTSVRLSDFSGKSVDNFFPGDLLTIEVSIKALESIESCIVGIAIFTSDFIKVCNFKYRTKIAESNENDESSLECVLPNLPLLPGVYLISVAVKQNNNRLLYRGENLAEFVVKPSELSQDFDGLVRIEPIWRYKHSIQDSLAGTEDEPII